jgi:hypothetical protein
MDIFHGGAGNRRPFCRGAGHRAFGWVSSKGWSAFAMPMIMVVRALRSFLPKELALAGLILPTLVTNNQSGFSAKALARRKATVRDLSSVS